MVSIVWREDVLEGEGAVQQAGTGLDRVEHAETGLGCDGKELGCGCAEGMKSNSGRRVEG